jgi:small subunit ribosomal protein S11
MADAKEPKEGGATDAAAKPEKAARAAKKSEAKAGGPPAPAKEAAPAKDAVAAAAGAEGATVVKKAPGRKKEKKNVPFAICNVHASFNNTVISITDQAGNVLSWSSAGCIGFKGSRKGTPFAAQLAAQTAGNNAKEHGVRQIEVRVKGPGAGRESSIRALQAIGLEVKAIKDVTPIPHNGCRPPKRRRV